MHTDAQRRGLYDALDQLLPPEARDTLMELLPPVGWSDVARQADISELRSEIAQFRADLTGQMAEHRAEATGEIAQLRAEATAGMTQLRADVTAEISDLRSEVRTQFPKLVATNVASMTALVGLVLAALQLG